MSLHVNLAKEVELELRRQAALRGLTPEALAAEILASNTSSAKVRAVRKESPASETSALGMHSFDKLWPENADW